MFMEYLGGPGLVRAYSLELLAETMRRQPAQARETQRGSLIAGLGHALQAMGRLAISLGDRLAKPREPEFCG